MAGRGGVNPLTAHLRATAGRRLVRRIASAARIIPPLRIRWFDEAIDAAPAGLASHLSAIERRRILVDALTALLYDRCFLQGGPAPEPVGGALATWAPRTDWLAALMTVAPPGDTWERGWILRDTEPAPEGAGGPTVRVARAGLELRASVEDVHPAAGAGPRARIRVPRARPHFAPGFLMVAGLRPLGSRAAAIRLYWNLEPEGLLELVRSAPGALDRAGLRWTLKALADPAAFARRDTAVLCVRRADYARSIAALASVAPAVLARVRPGVPAFVRPLGRGIGLAEEPAGGASFGASRCGLVAEGLVDAHETRADPFESVAARFATAGLDVDAPHLERSGPDPYARPQRAWADANCSE